VHMMVKHYLASYYMAGLRIVMELSQIENAVVKDCFHDFTAQISTVVFMYSMSVQRVNQADFLLGWVCYLCM